MSFLYKYKPINKQTIQILLNMKIYFPQSKEFNDPFDAKLLPSDFASEMMEMGLCDDPELISQHDQYVKDRITGYGIFCTSKKCNDILMWSHYADSHKGLCIGFNEKTSRYIYNDAPLWEEVVKYYDNHPFKDIYKDLKDGRAFNSPDEFINYCDFSAELLKAALSVKHKSWSYENEVRIVSEEHGLHEFNPEAIDHVVFGINTPRSDQDTVRSILASPKWQHVRVFHTRRSKAALSIDIVDDNGEAHGGTVPPSRHGTTCHT